MLRRDTTVHLITAHTMVHRLVALQHSLRQLIVLGRSRSSAVTVADTLVRRRHVRAAPCRPSRRHGVRSRTRLSLPAAALRPTQPRPLRRCGRCDRRWELSASMLVHPQTDALAPSVVDQSTSNTGTETHQVWLEDVVHNRCTREQAHESHCIRRQKSRSDRLAGRHAWQQISTHVNDRALDQLQRLHPSRIAFLTAPESHSELASQWAIAPSARSLTWSRRRFPSDRWLSSLAAVHPTRSLDSARVLHRRGQRRCVMDRF